MFKLWISASMAWNVARSVSLRALEVANALMRPNTASSPTADPKVSFSRASKASQGLTVGYTSPSPAQSLELRDDLDLGQPQSGASSAAALA